MNIVLDEAFEEKQGGEKVAIGMVVSRVRRHRSMYCAKRWTLTCQVLGDSR